MVSSITREEERALSGEGRGPRGRMAGWAVAVRTAAGRHRLRAVGVVLLIVLSPWIVSFVSTAAFGAGGSVGARATEWVRDHGGKPIVVAVENWWYSHHAPPKGGKPAAGAIPAPVQASSPSTTAPVPHLAPPAAITPFVSDPQPGEGEWHPAGRTVAGMPAVYEAFLRPDPVHTSVVVGVAWMDTKLLKGQLYSGSYVPGDAPWKYTAPVAPEEANSLVAAFNAGFRLQDAQGGYYSEGRTIAPLRDGVASIVMYTDGRVTVAQWGRDAQMGPDILAVRQNLHLLVDNGAVSPDINNAALWGATLGNAVYVWRSGLGVTADGALVYVGGPGLNATTLANVLVRAGAVRAMELDINTDWVNFSVYSPADPSGPASGQNGSTLTSDMRGGADRYFEAGWNRDFVAMSARSEPGAAPPRGR